MKPLSLVFVVFCSLVGVISAPVQAALQPEEVAIVLSKNNDESKALAAHYARQRSIPAGNILQLDLPDGEELPREEWEKSVRPVIRRWLATKNRLRKIRCFVTVRGVPLKISAQQDPKELRRLISYLKRERVSRIGRINEICTALEQLGGGTTTGNRLSDEAALAEIKARLDDVFGEAQSRIKSDSSQDSQQAAAQQLRVLFFRALGLNSFVQSLGQGIRSGASGSNPNARTEFDVSRGRALGLREGRAVLEAMPVDLNRENRLLTLLQLTDGVYGSIIWIDDQIVSLEKNETYASFDSELALAAWPAYQLIRWQPNLHHYRYDDSPIRDFKLTFMVSRIDAPSLQLARRIIDDSIAVEKEGLTGKIYLDGRGLAREGQPAQGGDLIQTFDQTLVATAEMIRTATNLEVVLDTKQGLFEADSAPEAAMYCGWYSLAKYVDAFDWQPGAIGYHLGGAEAITLTSEGSEVWCKRMLEEGVSGTVGPIADSLVSSYPRPNEFFALLLSGKYTLVESYYRCQPFNSWTMTLIGDPLYSPFQATRPLDTSKLDTGLRGVVDGVSATFYTPPSAEGEAAAGAEAIEAAATTE